jgi:hypothetical protein
VQLDIRGCREQNGSGTTINNGKIFPSYTGLVNRSPAPLTYPWTPSSPYSGVYLPTLYDDQNISGHTAHQCQWLRVGDTVNVSGQLDLTIDQANQGTMLGISLPIASNFSAFSDCAGVAQSLVDVITAAIYASTTNDYANMPFLPADNGDKTFYFTFTYRVI